MEKTWTIARLVKELQKYPLHFEVITEGCDCFGDCVDIAIEEGLDRIILLREKRKKKIFREPRLPPLWNAEEFYNQTNPTKRKAKS